MNFFKSLKRPFLCYGFETEKEELSANVTELCNTLKRGTLVIEVFINDSLNDILLSNTAFLSQNGNFNYYICEKTDFLKSIDFIDIRYFSIYSIEELPKQINNKELNSNFSFLICFENYFDTCHLYVRPEHYSYSIETYLNQQKYIRRKCFVK